MRLSIGLGGALGVLVIGAFAGCGDAEPEKIQSPATSTGGTNTGSGGSSSKGGGSSKGGSSSKGGATSTGGTSSSVGGATTGPGGEVLYGEPNPGEYHVGPVEWTGSFNNSCSPYPAQIQQIEGGMLAGLGLTHNGAGQLCDACILIKTDKGKNLVARVVTTGVVKAPNNIDLSQAAYDAIHSDEYPRNMTWQVTKCPDTGNIYYQFQTEAHEDWSSLWVRNNRIPLEKLEVKSKKHATWFALRRGNDGTYTDGGGFGTGTFTLRLTAIDGQVIEQTFPGFEPGDLLEGESNFQ